MIRAIDLTTHLNPCRCDHKPSCIDDCLKAFASASKLAERAKLNADALCRTVVAKSNRELKGPPSDELPLEPTQQIAKYARHYPAGETGDRMV